MKSFTLLLLGLLTFACTRQPDSFVDMNKNGTMEPYENPGLSREQRIEDLIGRMSPTDKINLVVGIGFTIPDRYEPIQELKVPGAVGATYTFEELGIPGMLTTDGPAGVRLMPLDDVETYYCTAFPIASVLSSSWDTELAREVGSAMGNEVKEYGMDILLAPALNIHRNPRAGRNFEYYSEDPLLSGKMAASVVRGVQSHGVGTSIKHFVANNQETHRMSLDVQLSERALREIYLKGFEIAVKESKPWTVMSSYNLVNGTEASQNPDLLQTVLREEWGFEGMVMTDWFAGTDPVAQINAGNDLLMPGIPQQREALRTAVEDGSLSVEALDRNVRRILETLFNSPTFNGYAHSNKPDLDGHAQLARRAAAEGTVLLKNKGVLPLETNGLKVAAFGIGSYDYVSGGTGSGDVVEAYTINLVQGLENAGALIDASIQRAYEAHIGEELRKNPREEFSFIPPKMIPEPNITASEVKAAAENNDIAFITIGRISGEFEDRPIDGDFELTPAEMDLIDRVSYVFHGFGKRVVVILNVGNVIETSSWSSKADAILLPWQGGQESGNAVADVLKGKVNPSGKLPTTWPIRYADVPSAKNFPGEETGEPYNTLAGFPTTPFKVRHEEGIYVGYRYYQTFGKEVAYPFGFGLSYTTFEYSSPSVSANNGTLTIKATIRNVGEISGREVVQVYVEAPGKLIDHPRMELRAFGKTRLLEPGESEELTFELRPSDYASWITERSSWVNEAGKYGIYIGASSADIRLSDSIVLEEEIVVETLSNALAPKVKIEEFNPRKKG